MNAGRSEATAYRVAGRLIVTDLAGPELLSLKAEGASGTPSPAMPMAMPDGKTPLVFEGKGWIVDRDRPIECRVDANAYRLRIGGVGSFWVALDGRSLGCSRVESQSGRRLARLALLGPAMTLALALQGTFCLHASAVEAASGAFAFAGGSGAGKSTLARMLDESSALGRRRAADDVLPVDLESGRATVRVDFPQLKLAPGEQPYLSGPSNLPLSAVFLLQPPSPEPRIERVGARSATLALVHHTVAARLLERHLRFAARLAERVPVFRLSYPWDPESLPAVAEALGAVDLG